MYPIEKIRYLKALNTFILHPVTCLELLNVIRAAYKIQIIAAFLGDTIKTVEENYMHLSPDYLRQAVDR